MFLFPNPTVAARDGLKESFNVGRLFVPHWSPFMGKRFLDFIAGKSSTQKQELERDAQNPKASTLTNRYQQQSWGFLTHPDINHNWRIETARFSVPKGAIGIVRAWEQYLEIDNDVLSTHYGNPNTVGSWLLRLIPYDGTNRPQFQELDPFTALPGIAFPDLPYCSGLWFPTASCSANNIQLIVPAEMSLLVIWESGVGLDDVPTVASKLRGSLQSPYSGPTIQTIRGSWS